MPEETIVSEMAAPKEGKAAIVGEWREVAREAESAMSWNQKALTILKEIQNY